MTNPILIAEDSPHDLEFTLFALEKCKLSHPVVIVRDGEEALDYLHARNDYASRPGGGPTLILLDLKMPKVDGLEVLKSLRTSPHLSSIPVIVLSHSALNEDVHKARSLGIDSYIVKPIELDQFRVEVCKAVSVVLSDKH
jgi:CheY-like chemotaxis protein